MLGYYYKIQDETFGILAGTVESPEEIESRLQDWQKEEKIYEKINEKYGTPEERIAKIQSMKNSLAIIKAVDFSGMKENIFNASGTEQSIATLNSTVLALIDICEQLTDITVANLDK